VNATNGEHVHVLPASGRIDAASAPLLDEQLRALHGGGAISIALDLADVTYLSSSGLRVLLLAQRRQAAAGGRLSLRNTPERVLLVLRVAGFDRVFTIEGAPARSDDAF
jgi:anti-anti-sigma factor